MVGALEESVRKETGAALPPVAAETVVVSATGHLAHASMGRKLAVLWSGAFAKRTFVAWVMWFCLTFASRTPWASPTPTAPSRVRPCVAATAVAAVPGARSLPADRPSRVC